MAWKKGKLLKSKRPLKRWSKNPQKVNNAPAILLTGEGETGATVLYRNHAKGDPNTITEDRTKQTYLGLPLSIITILRLYDRDPAVADGKKDEELPPVIQSMLKMRRAWQSDRRQGFDNVHRVTVLNSENDTVIAVLEGTRGYYLWHDIRKNCVRQSIVYTSEKMRHQWRRFDTDVSWDFQDQLRWIDIVFLPVSASG